LGFGAEFGAAAKQGIFQLLCLSFQLATAGGTVRVDVFLVVEDECGKLGRG
jgi:hypothetical protein